MTWSVLLPVRTGGKSRLNAAGDWSSACGLDTLDAISGCHSVANITLLGDLPTAHRTIDDHGRGLNAEISEALASMSRPVAVILGDLPALKSDDLDTVLNLALHHPKAFVRDAAGAGTTLVTFTSHDAMTFFGEDSANRHSDAGFVELTSPESVRRDVDTVDDVIAAAQMGLGKRTRELLAQLR